MTQRAEWRGDPEATKPSDVRKILRLVGANKKDVFYDLGCGHGRVCILAARKVRQVVGIEEHYDTYKQALRNVKKTDVEHKIKIKHSNVDKARLGDATIIYTILYESDGDLERYERTLKRGCRFATLYVPLIGIKPDKIDYPFYMMRVPFTHAKDEQDWVKSILKTKNATPTKLYKKLRHWCGRKNVKDIRKLLSKHLKIFQNQRKCRS